MIFPIVVLGLCEDLASERQQGTEGGRKPKNRKASIQGGAFSQLGEESRAWSWDVL